MTKLLTYNNDPKLKTAIVKEMKSHQKQDQFIKGTYGKENGIFKGCSVGCAVHSLNRIKGITLPYDNHAKLAEAIGIPEWLWQLNDTLFENLPDGENSQFSVDFLQAIKPGVDLTPVRWKFCAFILKENIERVLLLDIKEEIKKQVVDSIRGALVLHEQSIETGKPAESAAWSAAASAARAADSVARSAADSAARSAAWRAAESAAWSAADSAARAADSVARSAADSAARSAADSAAASAAWSAAASAARAADSAAASAAWSAADSAAYQRYAKELLRLLKEEGDSNG